MMRPVSDMPGIFFGMMVGSLVFIAGTGFGYWFGTAQTPTPIERVRADAIRTCAEHQISKLQSQSQTAENMGRILEHCRQTFDSGARRD